MSNPTCRRIRLLLTLTVRTSALVCATMTGASAQATPTSPPVDRVEARWQPWLGCWQLSEQSVRDDDVAALDDLFSTSPSGRSHADSVRVCVSAADAPTRVRMTTSIDGRTVLEEVIDADGQPHALQEGECRGMQRAEWSRSGQRLFSRAELTCAGERRHTVSHLATLHAGSWLDIQSVTRDGRQGVRVRRYYPAADREGDGAASPADAPFTIEDVKEASAQVTPLVLQAALVETQARFPLDGRSLIALDKAGVTDEITDLMVALSFPRAFKVERVGGSAGGAGWGPLPGWGVDDPFWGVDDVFFWGYAPFAFSQWGLARPWGYPGLFIVDPGPSGAGDGDPHDGPGRVVKGRGYTRIEPRRAERSTTSSDGQQSGSTSSGSSGGSSGGVSSQGYSGGSSGGASGRTAQPR
jgi:hypothetical protein